LTKKIHELDKNGTTQLRPDLVVKELAEVSTMRARGAHFAPLKKKKVVYEDTPKNVKVNLNDYAFLTEDGGEQASKYFPAHIQKMTARNVIIKTISKTILL